MVKFKKGNIPWNKGKKTGIKPWLGKKRSEEDKRKISIANKGKILSENHKLKIKQNHAKPMKGKKTASYIDGRSKTVSPARYGDDWEKIRFLVYERDDYVCQKCGKTPKQNKRALDIHHKIPFLESFDNSLSNLVTLCRKCHAVEEWKIKQIGELKCQL